MVKVAIVIIGRRGVFSGNVSMTLSGDVVQR